MLHELPDPLSGSAPWQELMVSFPKQWREIVNMYCVYESCFDRSDNTDSISIHTFCCNICAGAGVPCRAFKSEKDLQQHQRIKHKMRSPIPQFIDDSGICPACGVILQSRVKVIVHACETRCRGKSKVRCRDVILSGAVPAIAVDDFVMLEERDRNIRKTAKRKGFTHVRSICPAKRVASAEANRLKTISRLGNDHSVLSLIKDSCAAPLGIARFPSVKVSGDSAASGNMSIIVPRKRIFSKTAPDGLALERPKRLRSKCHESQLYRHV